jgi:hypothetical protein
MSAGQLHDCQSLAVYLKQIRTDEAEGIDAVVAALNVVISFMGNNVTLTYVEINMIGFPMATLLWTSS